MASPSTATLSLPDLVSIDPHIMRSEWDDAASASALERALHRLGFPRLSDLPIAWHDSDESVVGDFAESRMYRILAWEIPVAVSLCDRSGVFHETGPLWALSKILSAKLKDTKDSFLALGDAVGADAPDLRAWVRRRWRGRASPGVVR